MSSIFSSGIFTWQCKNMEKLSPNRAQLCLRNKYTVFTVGDTVALWSVNIFFPESYSSAASWKWEHEIIYYVVSWK